MRLLIQRVSEASVKVDDDVVGAINKGLLVFLGIHRDDTDESCTYLIKKLLALRIFADNDKPLNRTVVESGGSLLVVSQFTLYANCRKGNRPSFSYSMPSVEAEQMYQRFVAKLKAVSLVGIQTGIFGADMKVSLINDGPVTIILDA